MPNIDVAGKGAAWREEERRVGWINRTPSKTPACNFLWPHVAAPSLVRTPPPPPTDLRYLAQMLSEFSPIKVLILHLKMGGICENSFNILTCLI